MTSLLFECHITIPVSDALKGRLVAKELKWKTSQIDGDPVLGNNVYFYLTKYQDNLERMHSDLRQAVEDLRHLDVEVIREKIEQIVHDVRFVKA